MSQRPAGLGLHTWRRPSMGLGTDGLGEPQAPPNNHLSFSVLSHLSGSLHIALSKLFAPLDLSPCPLVLSGCTDFYKKE